MKIKKKFTTGTAQTFISRKRALKKLQLTLKDFRRLCILKGIYPREPKHIKKTNKGGSTQNRIYYHLKDIIFLSQESLIGKFREYKTFLRKVNHARAKRNDIKVQTLFKSKPIFNYDHIVKERFVISDYDYAAFQLSHPHFVISMMPFVCALHSLP